MIEILELSRIINTHRYCTYNLFLPRLSSSPPLADSKHSKNQTKLQKETPQLNSNQSPDQYQYLAVAVQ
jgi:hypothetical protein